MSSPHRHPAARRCPPLLLALMAGSSIGMGGCSSPAAPPPQALAPYLIEEPRTIGPFTLTDQEGRPFTEANLRGGWSVLFFGYTHCPDICPTALTTLSQTLRLLGQRPGPGGKAVHPVLISVDPARDTIELLKGYVGYFHPAIGAATGERAMVDRLARQVGVIYFFEGETGGNDYSVNHTASLIVVDPRGRYVAQIPPPHTAAGVASTLEQLQDYLR